MSVFVDTSALYALLDEADAHHVEASDALRRLVGTELVTHAFVVVEACALVGRRLPWPATERLVDGLLPVTRRPVRRRRSPRGRDGGVPPVGIGRRRASWTTRASPSCDRSGSAAPSPTTMTSRARASSLLPERLAPVDPHKMC
jgi:hypothetical protein